MDSVLKQLAKDFEGRAVVGKIYDNERDLMSAYKIKGLPTIMVVRDGEIKEWFLGGRSREVLTEVIKKHRPGGSASVN